MLTITRKDLLLTINDNVIPALGSSDVPLKFVNDTETYQGFLIEPRVGYYVNGCPKSGICEYDTSSNVIKIPAEAFKNKGILVISIALIDSEDPNHIEVTKELALEVTPAPNGTIIFPSEDTWQTIVLNLINQFFVTSNEIKNQIKYAVDNAIEDGSIANMTIEDDSITVEKLKGLEHEYQGGLNQIDYNNLIDGYKLDSTTGESVADEQYKVSNILPVEDNKYYYASINDWDGNTHIVFYNESNEFISSVKFGQSNIGIYGEIPANSKYAKACFRDGYKPVVIFSVTSISNNANNYNEFLQRYINNPWGNIYTNDIQQYFANNSIPIRTLNGAGAKLYNVFNNIVNEDINAIVIPIQEKYYIYNMSNEIISNSEIKLYALMKNKDCKLIYSSFIYTMGYNELTLADSLNIDDVICIVIDTKGLNENKLSNLMISSRNDLKEYHPYGEYYFEPTNEMKEFVKSAQTDQIKQYNGGVMLTIGDSYTAYMNSLFSDFAEKHGLIQDNRGVASSTIAGDLTGAVGYQPFWNRIDTAITEYTSGHTINDSVYNLEDVKLITFMGGANDWSTVNETINRLGNGVNTTDKNTLYGALNYCFNALLKNFPNADIVCILQPTNYVNTVPTTEDDAKNVGFESLEQVQAMDDSQYSVYLMQRKERIVRIVAEQYGIPICDCCFDWFNPCNTHDAQKYWNNDKLHLNADGHEAVIDKLEKTVNNLSFTRN